MAREILTTHQKKFIECVANHLTFKSFFYLTGGTALAAFYLNHRYSEDLDFFSEKEIASLSVVSFVKSLKKKLGYQKVELQRSLNRNLTFILF